MQVFFKFQFQRLKKLIFYTKRGESFVYRLSMHEYWMIMKQFSTRIVLSNKWMLNILHLWDIFFSSKIMKINDFMQEKQLRRINLFIAFEIFRFLETKEIKKSIVVRCRLSMVKMIVRNHETTKFLKQTGI